MSDRWPPADALRARWNDGCDAETLVDACLAALLETLHADCAIVFLGHPSGTASPWRGRDRADALSFAALEDASRTLVERCLTAGALATWDAATAAGGAHHRSAIELGILAAVAAPVGAPPRAALYVDFRSLRGVPHAARTDVVAEAAALLARVFEAPLGDVADAARAAPPPPPPDLDVLLTLPGLYAMAPALGVAVGSAAPVLVLGETGTGKTLLAHALAGRLARQPVVRAMLGTADDFNTIVSELFGHVRGAFSGATEARRGLVEQAHGGVLVLDEVLNLPLAAQQLLLDFTQFGEYRPLGHRDAAPRRADVRLVAVTNGDLDAAVRDGRFRADLYHRLAGTVLRVPPLRERRGDIPGLAAILLPRLAPGERWRLSRVARRALVSERLAWPGNVRQFEGVLRRAVARARLRPGEVPFELTPAHLDAEVVAALAAPAPQAPAPPEAATSLQERWRALQLQRAALDQEEDLVIQSALAAHGGTVAYAADALGVPRTTLASRLAKRARPRS